MFRDPVIKIFIDILFSWETLVVVLGFLAILIFFALSKKKYRKSSTSSTNTKIYSDLYSLNEMYKKGLINEEEYKKGKEFISKTIKESLKKEKDSIKAEKILIAEASNFNINEGEVPEQPKQNVRNGLKPFPTNTIPEEVTIPPEVQKLIDEGLITQTEYINKLKSLLK